MTTRRDYNAEALRATRTVLIELMQVLGEFRDHVVVVGGSVPGLLLHDPVEPHIGTLDIDLAFDFRNIPEASYQTLLKALTRRGYRQGGQPFQFFRDVPFSDRDPIIVEVDLLAGEYGGTGRSHRTQVVQDARARKTRGCDLVFDYGLGGRGASQGPKSRQSSAPRCASPRPRPTGVRGGWPRRLGCRRPPCIAFGRSTDCNPIGSRPSSSAAIRNSTVPIADRQHTGQATRTPRRRVFRISSNLSRVAVATAANNASLVGKPRIDGRLVGVR